MLSEPGALETATHWYRAFDYDAGDLGPVVDVPTLFVWGTDDPALGPDAARWTRDHVRGPYRFEVFEGVPHWIPEAQPDRLNALLLEHIAST
ncbi:MAG: alpha/beta hydrolase [Acidimicrobiia bacterium]|nr:alpha/beta hydrolase [Acidimicrobiia bacterium]